jgi:general secretion pathway protein G
VRPKEYILLAATISMLSMLIIPKIVGYERAHNEHAHRGGPRADLQGGIKSALGAFQVDNGFYPKNLQDLLQLPSGATNWHGPYLEKFPIDPWGHKYIYEYPGKHNPNGYDLFSAGPDGKPGTDDDIGNWMN